MQKSKRIFVIADFKEESPRSIHVQARMWMKGLLRLGHDVQRFSYRNVMMQSSPLSSKRIALKFGKKKADSLLVDLLRQYYPDIIFVLSMKYLDAETIRAMRDAARKAIFVGRDDDPCPEGKPDRIAIAKEMDIVITTSGGRFLQTYKDAGINICAFIPNMCDPDIQYNYDAGEIWNSDILFTGKAEHTRLDRNKERNELVYKLSKMPNARIYGSFHTPNVEGLSYFYAISRAKIALSINIANDVRLYHSDRLINYISCGTFTLAKNVPDSHLLFEDGIHLRYFDTADEFFERVKWYLEHEQERERIARTGMLKAHTDFSCVKIVQHVLDLIDTGTYDAPWAVIL